MTRIVATNITSPLGYTTEDNYVAVKRGETSLKKLDGYQGVPGRFCVGVFSDEQRKELKLDGFSWYESLMIHSVKDALSRSNIDPSSQKTLFIVGTATADIEELGDCPEHDGDYLAPGVATKKVADYFGFVNVPITVSNACISGGTAQMMAARLIASGAYDSAVVCGADVVSAFVLAGFNAFKALSPMECRPFDMERMGLNVGECAATLILTRDTNGDEEGWHLVDGCLNNDAYHVSAPIPSGDGVRRTAAKILTPELKESLACVTAHGTATMFNDQMESKAIEGAGLGDIYTTSYKPHFGHTFGASGIVEPIITMCSLDEGILLPVLGFEEIGVSGKIKICRSIEKTEKKAFIKTQSGFGGCNGSMIYSRKAEQSKPAQAAEYKEIKTLHIQPDKVILNGEAESYESTGSALVSEIFKKKLLDGSRFFKMDIFSRLAYVATGLLAKDALAGYAPEDIALFIFTQNGSVLADRKHLSTFSNPEDFYPSPAIFINTLPNVVLGEIAVMNTIKGETTLVMLPYRDDALIDRIVKASLSSTRPSVMIYGWVDCEAENSFVADLKMLRIVK